ncbi:MAG: LysR family transcriptional regulator [Cyanobacteriota bacterium]
MDLYQLKTFYTFGKVLSFTETARILYVSQSAISHSIKKLEQSLEIKLVERKSKKLALTAAGKELFESCETIFFEIEKAKENIFKRNRNHLQELIIGSTVEFGTTILIKHLKTFIDNNKNLKLDFIFSNDLSRYLLTDKVDFIIDCKKHFSHDIENINLFHENYVVIASPEFIKDNKITQLSDLERVPILSLDKEGLWWKNFLVSINISKRPRFKNINQISHIRGLINGAIEGIGVSFVPQYTVVNEIENNALVNLFPELRLKTDQFCIYIKKKKLSLDKNKMIIDYLTTIKPAEFSGF